MSEILDRDQFCFELREAIVDHYRFTPLHDGLLSHDAALRAALAEMTEALAMKRREFDVEVDVHNATKRERDRLLSALSAAAQRAENAEAALAEERERLIVERRRAENLHDALKSVGRNALDAARALAGDAAFLAAHPEAKP